MPGGRQVRIEASISIKEVKIDGVSTFEILSRDQL